MAINRQAIADLCRLLLTRNANAVRGHAPGMLLVRTYHYDDESGLTILAERCGPTAGEGFASHGLRPFAWEHFPDYLLPALHIAPDDDEADEPAVVDGDR
jgi:hypothetical protein